MANPNIVNVTSIYGNTAYVIPSTTAATTSWTYNGTTTLTGLTPAAGTVNRITEIVVSNTTSSAASATVAIGNNATFGSATVVAYMAYQISVPANASLIVTDKTTSFYVTENQSVGVTSGTSSALTYMATFEAIT
tara:strand:- start:948 stop:1352 length:405 start_codon:yes stop_codon:yes gene_type:complete